MGPQPLLEISMIKNIRHTGIVVDNLEESLSFYTGKLGFSISKKMNESGPFIEEILGLENLAVTTVKMSLGNQMIELLDFASHKQEPIQRTITSIGPTHVAFTVDNLDQVVNDFRRDGVEFLSAPAVSPDGYAKVAFCVAPEGTYIELVELLNE